MKNNYQIYLLDEHGLVVPPPAIIFCDTDAEAIGQAEALAAGQVVELRAGDRIVMRTELGAINQSGVAAKELPSKVLRPRELSDFVRPLLKTLVPANIFGAIRQRLRGPATYSRLRRRGDRDGS